MPEKKECVSVSKGVHKQKVSACKGLCNLQELYTAFKENTKCQYSLYVCSAYQNVVLLVDAIDWDLT